MTSWLVTARRNLALWTRRRRRLDGAELERSRQQRDHANDRLVEAVRVATTLRLHRERNHFADRMAAAYTEERR